MTSTKLSIIFLASLTITATCVQRLPAQSVYVPLNHWAYEFVERMETKGVLKNVLTATKPYSRDDIAKFLLQIEESGTDLNSVERDQLNFLRFEFKEEYQQLAGHNGVDYPTRIERLKSSKIGGKIFPKFLYQNHRNFFNIQSHPLQIFIDPIFYQGMLYANPDSLSGTERVHERSHGFTLWGSLGDYLGFFFDFRDTKEWGTRSYPRLYDITGDGLGFVNAYGTHIWHDETNAYVVFKLPYMQVMLGKDFNYWGPGFNGALSVSNNATSFDQIKLQAQIWRLKFTYFWGFLRTFPVIRESDGSGNTPKNIVGHRLELSITRWLAIGLHETVVFGDRRFELAYVNPINFYRSAEHFLGTDDNPTMGLDLRFMLIPNVKLYGELLVDDLSTFQGSDFFGNKIAFIGGGYWADAFTIPNLDGRIEYTRTRPYIYTHKKEINKYTNFATSLGHWLGPNADNLIAGLSYRFSRELRVAVNFQSFRHGANPPGVNVGGDIDMPFLPGNNENVGFLGGVRERRNSFGFEASYEIFRNFYFAVNFNSASSQNMALPGGIRGPVSRNEFFASIALNR
jgi:hypothetical protein